MSDEATVRAKLAALGQEHLLSGWTAETPQEKKDAFLRQFAQLDLAYPGGVEAYVKSAKKLLADSKAGANPLEGWSPALPEGVSLEFGGESFLEHEAAGIDELDGLCFVLVAGGLGERLGYSGIKVALPCEITSGVSFLETYIRSILALQRKASRLKGKDVALPLAIMVSDDTARRTEEFLEANGNFGMAAGQITLLKQEKVPCVADNDAQLALDPKDPFQILTKPHGHGDVHFLLHSSGTIGRWEAEGRRWVYFLQDTNALCFKVLPACLGVSKQLGLQASARAPHAADRTEERIRDATRAAAPRLFPLSPPRRSTPSPWRARPARRSAG